MDRILDRISSPEDIKKLDIGQLKRLADEVREKIISVTSRKGGHIASSLGAVELTIALHYCLQSPKDKIVWDVGHQCYAHKLLTGRLKDFDTLREMGGLSGFPSAQESEYDAFTSGHSATSISAALGLAAARDRNKEDSKVVAVIGDASLSTGLAFEGMNHTGHMGTNLVVVLNDNEHFISKPVGAMSRYLNRVIANPLYNKVREEAEKVLKSIPKLGPVTYRTVRKFQEGLKNLLVPGILFEELGFRYFGPINGHDLGQLIAMFRNIQMLKDPVFVHTITKKGKGYRFAEEDPVKFHGVTSFDVGTGRTPENEDKEKTFTSCFSGKIVELGDRDNRIVAITAAMPDGTGLQDFAERFPDRFFDVGITEPHAVTFAAGLAKGGMVPVVAIYSTFLQRSYDQLVHDVALQRLPVIFCVDRAGLVGKDGPTHHGVFDICYTRGLPGFIVAAPKDGVELEQMLEKAVEWNRPVVIRYPRAKAERLVGDSSCAPLEIGKAELLRKGKDLAILAIGSMVNTALAAGGLLSRKGIEATVINARFIKPLDSGMLEELAGTTGKIFTIEEGITSGGFGSAVLEFFARENCGGVKIRCLGLPDEFIEHGAREELLRMYHLTPDEVASTIEAEL
ncbi:MAG: 1-deoxy-D-xylulose-5-phosphate synthase [Candidatus Makaraimicrobium thalassicum]|nr:MAG: 1-deoxy-D-xylulose-5-phosphate synthase [Candidatus Omnitrophota bacterium]